MRIRKVDKNNDWCFGNGQADYLIDLEAIKQDIILRLQEWYNDCFFNLEQGIQWDVRLGYTNQKLLLDNDVKKTVLSVTGVLNLYNFVSQVNGRKYSCSFDVYTEYSTETISIYFEGV